MKYGHQKVKVTSSINKDLELCLECLYWRGGWPCTKTQKHYRVCCLCEGVVCGSCGGNKRPAPRRHAWPVSDEEPEYIRSKAFTVPSICCRSRMVSVYKYDLDR